MLVRTFRLTDKFSNALLKLAIYVAQILSQRIFGLRYAIETTLKAIFLTFALVLGTLTSGITQRGKAAATQRQERLRQAMVQRAERQVALREQELALGKVVEDPMLVRNRSLSAITVILLVALIAFLLWSPNSRSETLGRSETGGGIIPAPASQGEIDPVIPTPLPTPTAPNPILSNISGTLVLTLRQNGQDDIYALPVGSSQPIRLTDSLNDDRDPAWSPDGGKVVFASRRDGQWDLYLLDLVEGSTTRLTFTADYEGAPTWSPDGVFIAYEGYNQDAGNLDIYIIRADGQQGPIQLTHSPYPEIEPDWSPGGRDIAYIGWRSGTREVLVLNLDGQPEGDALNLSDSGDADEDAPVWSPDGSRIAYTSRVDGIDGIYVKSLVSPNDDARLIGRGTTPAWNPVDGSSVFYSVPQADNSALYLGQVDNFAIGANAIAFEGQVSDVDWTASQHNLRGFDPRTPPLYEEHVAQSSNEKIGLAPLADINSPDPFLSDAVNDSFEAMRRRAVQIIGYDLLSSLESTFWRRERPPEPGQSRTNWHYTGRALDLNRDLVFAGNPTPLVIIREDTETGTFWRVMARVAETAQNGQLGEPLRSLPWDFASRADDPEAFEEGGKLMETVPPGYYVDVTQLFADFGWERVAADRTWRSNFSGVQFWQFQKTENMSWEEAMLQVYSDAELQEFLAGITPPLPTPIPVNTPIGGETGEEGEPDIQTEQTPVTAIPNATPIPSEP